MINPADDEINIILPLALGAILIVAALPLGFIAWLLSRKLESKGKNALFEALKAAVFSIAGIFLISAVIQTSGFFIRTMIGFFAR